jgi:hypothetical protein
MRAVDNTIIGALNEHGRHDNFSGTPADLVELNVRLLAKAAKEFDRMRLV